MIVKDLENEVKLGKVEGIYLLYGEETYLIEMLIKKVKKTFPKLIAGINYIMLDESNIENLIQELQMPAFGYDKKLIIVKNLELFKKEAKKKNIRLEDIKNNINNYIQNNIEEIKERTVIIFAQGEIEKEELFKTIEKLGTVCIFERLKPIELIKKLKGICNSYEVEIDENTLKLFIETCGTSMQILINEIRKLIEYAGKGGKIQKEDIDKLCIKEFDSIIFDLTDNLGKKKIKEAIQILNELIYNKEPVQKILITLYSHFKKLYLVKLSQKYNKDIGESLNLKQNQVFLISKYKNQASSFDENELRKIMQELINLDSNNKIGLIDINVGLEAILATYCS